MNQKTLVTFLGSPRKKGHSTALTRSIAEGAKDVGFEVKEYYLNDKGIRGCQSCFYCREHEGCSVKDYLAPMYQDIRQAEAIVVASPIYYAQVTGQTKLWLDRTFPFSSGSLAEGHFGSRLPGKKVITVFSQNHGDPNAYKPAMEWLHGFFVNLYEWKILSTIAACGELEQSSREFEALLKRAYAAGRGLAENLD